MLSFPPAVRIWLALAPTDRRKGFDALAELVRQHLASIEAPSVRLLRVALLQLPFSGQRLQREELDFAGRFAAVFEVATAAAGNR
jgi:hypothetical protein